MASAREVASETNAGARISTSTHRLGSGSTSCCIRTWVSKAAMRQAIEEVYAQVLHALRHEVQNTERVAG